MAASGRKILKFIWKIENFSYCWQKKDDFVASPEFVLDIFGDISWYLKLYPRGNGSYEDYVGVYLERYPYRNIPEGITIDFEIALLKPNGEAEFVREMKDSCFRKGTKYGFDNLIPRKTILGARKSTLLPKDVLTIQCCIFHKHSELKAYMEVIGKTHTKIERYHRQWKAIDYTELIDIVFEIAVGHKQVTIGLIVSNCDQGTLRYRFQDGRDIKVFHCKIGVLDSYNSVVKYLLNKFIDIDVARSGTGCDLHFPDSSLTELLDNKTLCLPNGKVNFDCELTCCYGELHNQIELMTSDAAFPIVATAKRAFSSEVEAPSKRFLYCVENTSLSLQNDFENLLQEGALSDFTLRVGTKSLQVHKSVLCARSPVFKKMLTSDMEEIKNNMVEILDLEEDTVQRMVAFMYSDRASNLDWGTAKKLFIASYKYCLIPLKHICSEVLKRNLSVSNVKEVLILADMHGDDDLRKTAIEFICNNEAEVMCSTEWKSFIQENLHLAAETMFEILIKKGQDGD